MAVGKVTGSFEFCLNNCGAKMCIFIKDLLYSHENVMTKIPIQYNELTGLRISISDALHSAVCCCEIIFQSITCGGARSRSIH